MANLDAALERTRSTAPSTTVQGRRFERMFRAALLNHPGEFRDKFTRMWLWDNWPGRDGPENGVDLVAEGRDGNVFRGPVLRRVAGGRGCLVREG